MIVLGVVSVSSWAFPHALTSLDLNIELSAKRTEPTPSTIITKRFPHRKTNALREHSSFTIKKTRKRGQRRGYITCRGQCRHCLSPQQLPKLLIQPHRRHPYTPLNRCAGSTEPPIQSTRSPSTSQSNGRLVRAFRRCTYASSR